MSEVKKDELHLCTTARGISRLQLSDIEPLNQTACLFLNK